jgi:hypothetical protein
LGTAKTITFLTNSLIIIWREGHFAHVARNLLLVVYKNPGHTKFWQEAVLHLRNMYLLWKNFWIKKTALPSIKKIE